MYTEYVKLANYLHENICFLALIWITEDIQSKLDSLTVEEQNC